MSKPAPSFAMLQVHIGDGLSGKGGRTTRALKRANRLARNRFGKRERDAR